MRADEDVEKRREIDPPACQPGDEFSFGEINAGVVPGRAIGGQLDELVSPERSIRVTRGDAVGERPDLGDVRLRVSFPGAAGHSVEEG